MKVKRMDLNGHSCLAEKNGMEAWVPEDADVSLDFAESIIRQHINGGYMLVDETSKSIVQPEKLRSDTTYILMPPIIGG